MGSDYTVAHAAVLAAQLPPHSRCSVKANPDAAWSDERAVLERIDYHLQYLMWMQSKDGANGRNRPEPPRTPSQLRAVGDRIKQTQLNKAEVDRILGIGPT